jgi:hypothetical protein
METSKYFTPDIEDIRVGYECEFAGWMEGHKPSFTVGQGNITSVLRDIKVLRVPYLTPEQIEAEGWIPHWSFKDTVFDKGRYRISLLDKVKRIWWISEKDIEYGYSNRIYAGLIPSINEFRTINKLLKINNGTNNI